MNNHEKRINYAHPVTAIIADLEVFFNLKIEKYSGLLKDKKIIIFGAGTRGTQLLLILEKHGYKNIIFCDNNHEKLNGHMNGYPILSFSESLKEENKMFLMPVEDGNLIIQQLINAGLKEEVDFINMEFNLYDEYLKEFKRPVTNHTLIFGDCAFSHVSINDDNKISLGDMIKNKYGVDNCKILAMHGMGTRSFYHITKALIKNGEHPKSIMVEIHPMMMAPKAYIMPRTQHPKLIKMIKNTLSINDDELDEYVTITQERFNRFQIETSSMFNESNLYNNSKLYMKMNYMYTINNTNERIIYLKNLIIYLNNLLIPVILYIPPLNYKYGESIWGENLTYLYKKIYNDLWSILNNVKYKIADASFLFSESDFAAVNNHDEMANFNGRLKLLDFLDEYIK